MVKFRNRSGGLSDNLEDRRGSGGVGRGMGLPIPMGKGMGGGIIGIIIVLAMMFLGGGLPGGGGSGLAFDTQGEPNPADDELVQFMSDALDDIQAFWGTSAGLGDRYEEAKLVLFTNAVQTDGCGNPGSAVGPFYCPADSKAYIDLSFFRELRDRFGAPGDFAQVYVLAHELGHHVQNVLGTSSEVRQAQQRDPSRANELSVRLELQADCYAGVWGNSAQDRGILEPGDLEEGIGAAEAVGDDRLGNPSEETWTHGSAESRARWFQVGFETGNHESCDTFAPSFDDL